jgi:long-chain acyl-CoA synthetase
VKHGSFWRTAAADPGRAAVIEDGGRTTSYGELAALANRIANGLLDHGLQAGDTVALLMSNRMEFLAVHLATHQVGLRLAPLNRHLTGLEAGYILRDCGARLLIADSAVGGPAAEAADLAGVPGDARFSAGPLAGFQPLESLLGEDGRPAGRTSGSLLLYSSGTTGRPKGIERSFSGADPDVELDLAAERVLPMGVTPGGVFLGLAPLYHSAPNQHTFVALQLAQTVVLGSGFDPAHVLGLIQRYQVTDTFLVPTMMHRLVTTPAEIRFAHDLSSLRLVVHAGSICPVPVKRAMIDWLGPILLEYYGASESGKVTQITAREWLAHPGSVGRAEPDCDVRVRDELGHELPPGEPGLLHLLAPRPFTYHNDPDKTQRSHRDGYFIPGDVGYIDADGWLYLCDRRTDMIISGGVNIYPAEIEAELLQHDAVADAVVIGVPDEEWGQRVVALVELREGWADRGELTDTLLAHCRQRLAKFKVPRVLEVVPKLPRTPTGKLSRGQVRQSYLATGQAAG